MSHVGLSDSREFCMDLSCADTTLSTSMFIRLNSSKHPLGDRIEGERVGRGERRRRRGQEMGGGREGKRRVVY